MLNKTNYSSYRKYLKAKEGQWEDLCRRCGGCCGAYDDPCKHLKSKADKTFFCTIYRNRLGERESVGGEIFDCVQVRKILHTHWRKDHLCVYKKIIKNPLSAKSAFKKS
tara:strand:- start:208 stop:534 length:327 start_codon:yes stop_codon:yes gene_type:complete